MVSWVVENPYTTAVFDDFFADWRIQLTTTWRPVDIEVDIAVVIFNGFLNIQNCFVFQVDISLVDIIVQPVYFELYHNSSRFVTFKLGFK